jgi:hypothetical protein
LKVILYFFARPRSFLSLSSAILRQRKKCQYVGKRREEELYYLTVLVVVLQTMYVKEEGIRERSLDNSWPSRNFPGTPAKRGTEYLFGQDRNFYTAPPVSEVHKNVGVVRDDFKPPT